jgi:hypothetical protein
MILLVVAFPPMARLSYKIIPVKGTSMTKGNEYKNSISNNKFKFDPLSFHANKYRATSKETDIQNQTWIYKREKDMRGHNIESFLSKCTY